MDYFFSLFIFVASLIPFLFIVWARQWLVLPIFFAFLVRFFTAILHRFVFPLPQGSADAIVFDRVAQEWAFQFGCGGFFEHFNPSASYVYSSLMALLYSCVEYMPFSVQMINVVLGTYAVIFLSLSAFSIWGRLEGRNVALVLAFFPFLVIFSSVGLRETFIFFFFSLGIYFLVLFNGGRRLHFLMLSVISFYVSSLFHGAMILAVGGAFVYLAFSPLLKDKRTKEQYGYAVILSFVLLFFLCLGLFYVYSNLSFHKIGNIEQLDVDQIAQVTASRADGDAAYLESLQINNFFDFLWQAPVRVFYFLFSPFPWDISKIIHFAGMLDGFSYLFFTLCFFKYRKRLLREPAVFQIVIILSILALAFAFGTSNFGTATRHRAKFYLAILVVVAPALSSVWRKESKR